MRILLILLALTTCACASRFDAGARQHMRHERNSQMLHDLKVGGAAAEAVERCGGKVELLKGREGTEPSDYRCAAP